MAFCVTMLGIRRVGVYGCQSDDPFVCFGAKPTQRPVHETGSGRGKEGPKEDRRRESAEERRREQSA